MMLLAVGHTQYAAKSRRRPLRHFGVLNEAHSRGRYQFSTHLANSPLALFKPKPFYLFTLLSDSSPSALLLRTLP